MDQQFDNLASRLTAEHIASAREWQKTSRFYQLVQALQRRTLNVDRLTVGEYRDLLRRVDDLDAAIDAAPGAPEITVYRGIRSLRQTFNVDTPMELLRDPIRVLPGYTATSVHRDVAQRDFADAGGGALLEIQVPAGTPALWVAGIGDPQLRWQGEFLLPADLTVRFLSARHDGLLVVLSVQVIR